MLEPLRNPVNWDSFRKVARAGLYFLGAVGRHTYFFVLGVRAAALRQRTYFGALFSAVRNGSIPR